MLSKKVHSVRHPDGARVDCAKCKIVELGLCRAISEADGNIVSVGSFDGDVPGERELVVKVRGAGKNQLVDMMEALGDHVADARDV